MIQLKILQQIVIIWKTVPLLQLAIAIVSNLSNTKSDNSAIPFDTSSQRSSILTEL